MTSKPKNWLVIGVPKNWETALSQPVPIWGLKPRYQTEFQAMEIGDTLWFYVTRPVSGVIGMGTVKDKYVDQVNLVWEEELKKKEVIWPLRFRIHVLKLLPRSQWKSNFIKISDFGLFWQGGFQLLSDKHALELMKRAERLFGNMTLDGMFAGATITGLFLREKEEESYGAKENLSHRKLQEQIAEIGKLQFYYTQLEYPVELPGERKSLDVVWKREIDGVPTFTFEVELSGMIERAIERLRFAYQKWNSRPRIIVPGEFVKKVHNIVGAGDRSFSQQFRVYEIGQIVDLLRLKRKLRETEQRLKLY